MVARRLVRLTLGFLALLTIVGWRDGLEHRVPVQRDDVISSVASCLCVPTPFKLDQNGQI